MNEVYRRISREMDRSEKALALRLRARPYHISKLILGALLFTTFGLVDGYFTFLGLAESARQADGSIPLLWGFLLLIVSTAIVAGFALAFDLGMEKVSSKFWDALKIVGAMVAIIGAFAWAGSGFAGGNGITGIDPITGLANQTNPNGFNKTFIETLDFLSILILFVFFVLTAIGVSMFRVSLQQLWALREDAKDAVVVAKTRGKLIRLTESSETLPRQLATNNRIATWAIAEEVERRAYSLAKEIDFYLAGNLINATGAHQTRQSLVALEHRLKNGEHNLPEEARAQSDFIVPAPIDFQTLPPADQLEPEMRDKFQTAAQYLRARYEKGQIFEQLRLN